MRHSSILRIVLVVVIAVAIAGCSATPTRRSFNEGWKDSVLSTKVKYKLIRDKQIHKRNFDVDTWRGVVTLTGRARSGEEKERAEQLALQVRGVKGVDNFLRIIDDAYVPEKEAVAKKGIVETDLTDIKAVRKTPAGKVVVKEEIREKKIITEPAKAQAKTQVGSRVESPEIPSAGGSAGTGRYNKPDSSDIDGEDLTDEDGLAREAAEELKRLRGEDADEGY